MIEFETKGFNATNKITLGKGQNNMWSYGLYYGTPFEIAIQPNSAQRDIIKQIKYKLEKIKKVDENNQLSIF